VCGPCSEASHCTGGLCSTSQTCAACTPGVDDQACRDAYADPDMACQSDGTCAPSTCTAGTDCQLVGLVCATNGRCAACSDTQDCLDALHGGYPAGTLCVSGRCVEANCITSSDCPIDRPICGSDSRCRACQDTPECLARAGVSSGHVCDTDTGRCHAGDCFPNAAPCSAPGNGICDNYTCRACHNEVSAAVDDCQLNGYPSSVLCVAGACVSAECNDVVPCAHDRICDQSVCVDCTASDNSYCLANGMTCDTGSKTCVGCTNNSQCAGGQRICDNTVCRDCLPGECATGRVCAGGACLEGDCWIDGQVWVNGGTKVNDVCSRCTRTNSQFAWSANPNFACDDNNPCSQGDICHATVPGVCNGAVYSCPDLACADGVCHGTGPTDCTLEKKPSWTGCFLDDACFFHGDPNPANPCQLCDGTQNAWVDKPEGTRCGFCKICQRPASSIVCDFVPSGQDPHNDCTANCQVCDNYGSCRWADAGSDPEGNCPAELATTCTTTGQCAGGSDRCAFWSNVSGVDDENECTDNDRCDGLGKKIGDPLTGTWCRQQTKVCHAGVCEDCLTGECPTDRVCDSGTCLVGVCNDPADCGQPPQCKGWACNDHQCEELQLSTGWCDDGNPCTLSDFCQIGECQAGTGEPNCSAEDDSCNVGVCVMVDTDNYRCEKSPLAAGTSCNDDNLACTVDQCAGPEGAPRSCALHHYLAGTCFIDGVCYAQNDHSPNGCGYCNSLASQTSWQPVAAKTPCGTSACDEVCSGINCVARWYVPIRPCIGGSNCIIDRDTEKSWYYYDDSDADTCPEKATWADATTICAGDLARLPTRAELIAIVPHVDCTTTTCNGGTINLPPAFAGKAMTRAYWTSEDLNGDGKKNLIGFQSSGYAEYDASPDYSYWYLCVDD
ncbi:MAG: hypothetical protein JXR83_21785, partial [Deltaproteobacteria bacterium]|nr:hypothetical protein [Deltaproteobacteria bacterium]